MCASRTCVKYQLILLGFPESSGHFTRISRRLVSVAFRTVFSYFYLFYRAALFFFFYSNVIKHCVPEKTDLAQAGRILPKSFTSFKTWITFIFVVYAILFLSKHERVFVLMALFATRNRYRRALFRLIPFPNSYMTIPDTVWQKSCPIFWSSGKMCAGESPAHAWKAPSEQRAPASLLPRERPCRRYGNNIFPGNDYPNKP